MEWEPIETAPKDGTGVLAFWMPLAGDPVTYRHYALTQWQRGQWVNPEELDTSYTAPTHWMPLPEAPHA